MDLCCTRPGCPRSLNSYPDLDDPMTLETVQQKYCTTCGMPLILDGRYLPTRLLGQGGFGAAFLACDRRMPDLRPCVVKQFQPSGNFTPAQLQEALRLFKLEGKVLAELGNHHPQIPDLYAFFVLTVPDSIPGKQDQFFYLVQEYIDGQTLEEELAQRGVFSETEILEILDGILTVLKFVHAHQVIHRDIKLSNIMRHRNGKLYLLDFGAVKQATQGGGGNVRSTGIYSAGIAPPEQVAGAEVYPSSDLYALAVTCLMLLTGKQPTDLYDSYRNVWQWKAHVPQISDRLVQILDRLLCHSPRDRFQSAEEVLQALHPPSPAVSPPRPHRTPGTPTTAPPPRSSTVLQPPPIAPPAPVVPPPPPPRRQSAIAPFSALEILAGAAFTGWQGSLLAIALLSLIGTNFVTGGFWLVLLVGLILAQSRRWIERWDLVIFGGVSLGAVLLFPLLRRIPLVLMTGNPYLGVLFLVLIGSLLAVAIASFFRLIYNILSRFI